MYGVRGGPHGPVRQLHLEVKDTVLIRDLLMCACWIVGAHGQAADVVWLSARASGVAFIASATSTALARILVIFSYDLGNLRSPPCTAPDCHLTVQRSQPPCGEVLVVLVLLVVLAVLAPVPASLFALTLTLTLLGLVLAVGRESRDTH